MWSKVAQGPQSGPFALLRAGSAASPAVWVLSAPQSEKLLASSRRRPNPHVQGRAVQTTSAWKSRRAGERALRYFLLWHVARRDKARSTNRRAIAES
jgi:hypothetical protein